MFGEFDEIELARGQKNRQERQQQRHAADHGINKELRRGGRACGPPQSLIRKNAGIRLSSQKMNQWKKFSAVKVPEQSGFQKENQREIKRDAILDAARKPAWPWA